MSTTNTSTFTVTHAEYLSSKIAADLKQIQALYGDPKDARIDNYVKELIILLKGGYMSSVTYGYEKDGKWVLAVSYSVNEQTGLLVDNNPGRVPVGIDVSGCRFYSYLITNQKHSNLSTEALAALNASLPFSRGDGDDPSSGLYGTHDKTYSAGGSEIKRQIIK